MTHAWRWACSIWQDGRIRKGVGLGHEMRSTEEVELPKTQHHHHAAYNTVRRELQLFSNLCEREPPGVLTPTCSAERFHRSNYKTGNITTNPARVRHLDSLSLRIQTTAFFHLSSSKPPRMLADEWQSNPNRTGQGQGKAEADQRDHIHTANEIISITGGGKRGRMEKEDSTGHHTNLTTEEAISQTWSAKILVFGSRMAPPLISSSTAMSLGSRERERGREKVGKGGWQKEREYYEFKMILNKMLSRCISNIWLNDITVIRCWSPVSQI